MRVFRATDRGQSERGWLSARFYFSFGEYQDPERMGFGALRVLNEDRIQPAQGFETHAHQNMEIITIPLSGSLKHRDNLGNEGIIWPGEIQLMSAGKGIRHSEFNASKDELLHLFQIWIEPNERNTFPSYQQMSYDFQSIENGFLTVVSPNEEGLKIKQDAFFSLGRFKKIKSQSLPLREGYQAFLLLIEGEAKVKDQPLSEKDALGFEGLSHVDIELTKDSYFLLIETRK